MKKIRFLSVGLWPASDTLPQSSELAVAAEGIRLDSAWIGIKMRRSDVHV